MKMFWGVEGEEVGPGRVCVCVCGSSDYLPHLPFSHLPPFIPARREIEWYKGKTRTWGGDGVSLGSLQERHIQTPFMKYCSSSY